MTLSILLTCVNGQIIANEAKASINLASYSTTDTWSLGCHVEYHVNSLGCEANTFSDGFIFDKVRAQILNNNFTFIEETR
jgi:hypothetical protein